MWLLSAVGTVCIFAAFAASVPKETSLDVQTAQKSNLTNTTNQNMLDITLEEVGDDHNALFPDSFHKTTETSDQGNLDNSTSETVDKAKPELHTELRANSTKAASTEDLPRSEDVSRQISSAVPVSSTSAPNPEVGQIIPSATIAELPSLVEDFEDMFEPAQFTDKIIPTGSPIMTQPIMAVSMTTAASVTEPPTVTIDTTAVKFTSPVIPTRIHVTEQPMITAPILPGTTVLPITESETTIPSTTDALPTAQPSTTTVSIMEEHSTASANSSADALTIEEHPAETENTTKPSTTPVVFTFEERPTESTRFTSAEPSTTAEAFTTQEQENIEILEDRKPDVDASVSEVPEIEILTTQTAKQANTTTEIPAVTRTIATATPASSTTDRIVTSNAHATPTSTTHRTTTQAVLANTMQEPTTESIGEPTTSITLKPAVDISLHDTAKPVTVWAIDEARTTTSKPRLSRPWILKPFGEPSTTERVFIVHAVPSHQSTISATNSTLPKVLSQRKNITSVHNGTIPLEALSPSQKNAIKKFLDAKRHNSSVGIKATTSVPVIRHTTLTPQVPVPRPNPGSGFANPVITNPIQQQIPAFFPQARPVFPFTNFQTFPNQQPVMPFQPVQTNFLPSPVNTQNSFFVGR